MAVMGKLTGLRIVASQPPIRSDPQDSLPVEKEVPDVIIPQRVEVIRVMAEPFYQAGTWIQAIEAVQPRPHPDIAPFIPGQTPDPVPA